MKTTGRISLNPRGFAFVVRDNGGPDVFIPPGQLNGTMDNDLVEIKVFRDNKGPRGKILSIVKRAETILSGRYVRRKKWGILETNTPFPYTVIIPHGFEGDASPGDIVRARIIPPKKLGRTSSVSARIETSLNMPEGTPADLRSVAIRYSLPWIFSQEVEKEALAVSSIDMDRELSRREDLREDVLFTIDGKDAKDFDDAVGIVRHDDNTYTLTVAIADVSYLVRKKSVLDKEALTRSFSVYFPGTCIPMLPETLSNGILSLRPDEDRLALAVHIHLGPRGRIIDYTCTEAVIRSNARLTYEEVSAFLETGRPVATDEVHDALSMLSKLTSYLSSARRKRGSLDFDMPETMVDMDIEGSVDCIYRRSRNEAERIIEESMILANRTVCMFLEDHNMPVLYRIHENPEPDAIESLARTLTEIGTDHALISSLQRAARTGSGISHALMKIADAYAGKPSERFVQLHILRSLKQAIYHHEDKSHFGLSCRGYLHFTSPIRRYPDLVVHRLTRMAIEKKQLSSREKTKLLKTLRFYGPETSKKERITNEAMFEAIRLRIASYMTRHIGEIYSGVIGEIRSFGAFVELIEIPADGMIPPEYPLRGLSAGDIVRVRIAKVDLEKGLIDLEMVAGYPTY